MTKEENLREHLLALLKGGHAHMTFQEAIKDFPQDQINAIFPNGNYSFWQLLEHLRRTQSDILEFITSSDYQDKEWPKDYWPKLQDKASISDWQSTVRLFEDDAHKLEQLVKNPKSDLYVKIPWGDGQTLLREILLVCDHNAYHIGEFAIMRQVLKVWNKDH